MSYGILVAIGEGESFQIIDHVSSKSEAIEMAENYMEAGAGDDGSLAPSRFEIHRRKNGLYTIREPLPFFGEEGQAYEEELRKQRREAHGFTLETNEEPNEDGQTFTRV